MRHFKRNLYLIICFIIILFCSSCKNTEYIEVPVEIIKTEYVHNKDSIYEKDSVWSLVDKSEDTVYIKIYKEKIKYVSLIDTVCKTDTITKVVKIKEAVEVNKLKKWQKLLMWLGGGALLGLFGTIIFKLKKWKLLF